MKDSLSAGLTLLGMLIGAVVGYLIQRGAGGTILGGVIGLVVSGVLVDLYRRRRGNVYGTYEQLHEPAKMDTPFEEEVRADLVRFQDRYIHPH